ncbi:endonuclease V [Flammeovirgaceae bacterium SG7u.111]|nr:endonuclease V [Flammeovirgaceae bacterium SG7u.132]WPO36729.1 endonuclease V [Flammeovirgaceae bacterium SG7u.111]
MILCLDVQYSEEKAFIAGGLFEKWTDANFLSLAKTIYEEPQAYESGKFYKRELPCLLKLIGELETLPSLIVIDGYCFLSSKEDKGLGSYLFDALDQKTPIVGVAKNSFKRSKAAIEIYRGQSEKPLFVTAVGIETNQVAEKVKNMHGEYRIPTLLKLVDSAVREMAKDDEI